MNIILLGVLQIMSLRSTVHVQQTKLQKKFNVKELVLLESKITKSNSEEEELKVLMANKKMEEIVADCVSKVIK